MAIILRVLINCSVPSQGKKGSNRQHGDGK